MTTTPPIPAYEGDHTFSFPGTGTFTIHHGADPKETFDVITVVIPAEDSFTVQPHYHLKATEWMKLIEGHVEGTIDGEKRVLRAGDDWLKVAPGVRHSFHKKGGKDGVKVVWRERSGPDPGQKKRFFEEFLATNSGKRQDQIGFFYSLACFYRDGDSFIALPGGRLTDPLGWFLVYIVGGFVHYTGLCKPKTQYKAKAA